MEIKQAMKDYFDKLIDLWRKEGTLPLISWDEDDEEGLFISEPNEDQEVEWKPKEIEQIRIEHQSKLCEELLSFFSSFYYWRMAGRYNGFDFTFPAMNSSERINEEITTALENGKEYFPNSNCILIASVVWKENDDLLAFYDQKNNCVFIYDQDKKEVLEKEYSLLEIIQNMEPLL